MRTENAVSARSRVPAAAALSLRDPDVERAPFVVALVAFVAVIATNLISLEFDHLRTTVINANWEYSWSHELDALALVLGAYAAVVGWQRQPGRRRLWAATGVILVLFFLDEISPLHAQIGSISGGKLLYVPILAALVACLWLLTRGTNERVLVSWALVTLLLSFVMHTPGLHILRRVGYTNWVYQAGVGFKEGTELAGLILVVWALWRLSHRPEPVS